MAKEGLKPTVLFVHDNPEITGLYNAVLGKISNYHSANTLHAGMRQVDGLVRKQEKDEMTGTVFTFTHKDLGRHPRRFAGALGGEEKYDKDNMIPDSYRPFDPLPVEVMSFAARRFLLNSRVIIVSGEYIPNNLFVEAVRCIPTAVCDTIHTDFIKKIVSGQIQLSDQQIQTPHGSILLPPRAESLSIDGRIYHSSQGGDS